MKIKVRLCGKFYNPQAEHTDKLCRSCKYGVITGHQIGRFARDFGGTWRESQRQIQAKPGEHLKFNKRLYRKRNLVERFSTKNTMITDSKLARFAKLIRQSMKSDDPAFRKAYLRLFVETVTVGDAEI